MSLSSLEVTHPPTGDEASQATGFDACSQVMTLECVT